MSERFVTVAAQDGADTWVRRVNAGELVSVGQRNAFLGQAAGLMDLLARPGRILTPDGPVPPRAVYRGPNATFNGREVPVFGSFDPPAAWWAKPPARTAGRVYPRTAGAAGGGSKPFSLADLLEPTEADRRRYWLALHGATKAMNGSGAIVGEAPRDAGVLPVAAVVVIAVAGIAALATLIGVAANTAIRETQETARNAAELEAAAREYAQRLQWAATHPGQPMPPPGPAEVRVNTPRPSPTPGGPAQSPLDAAVARAVEELGGIVARVIVGGVVTLVAISVVPPIIQRISERAAERALGERNGR